MTQVAACKVGIFAATGFFKGITMEMAFGSFAKELFANRVQWI